MSEADVRIVRNMADGSNTVFGEACRNLCDEIERLRRELALHQYPSVGLTINLNWQRVATELAEALRMLWPDDPELVDENVAAAEALRWYDETLTATTKFFEATLAAKSDDAPASSPTVERVEGEGVGSAAGLAPSLAENDDSGASSEPLAHSSPPVPSGWTRYSPSDMHRRLIDRSLSDRYRNGDDDWISNQALSCPYYVPLLGHLGADWGVIVNPESTRFGLLTFEHDECGCPLPDRGDDTYHEDCPDQDGDMWCDAWVHICDDWCHDPCEEAAAWGRKVQPS